MSRRQVLAGAGGTGLLAATVSPAKAAMRARRSRAASDGTPEQVHLTWSENPATGVVVSWASPGQARRPRVRIGQRVVPAEPRPYTDGISGETVWTYHARVGGLRPGATYAYAVTADNDGNATDPFSATFRTAPAGRGAFRFTSFGDLATPNTSWVLSYGQSAYVVETVESFQPLFHLLNGDLCYANLNPTAQPEVWRDFGNNNQTSAANRPWMPCLGNHEVEFCNGPQGFTPGREVATGAVVDTLRPRPVTTTDSDEFDTRHGTVHLILGCGGTDAPLDEYGTETADDQRQAKVFTTADRPVATSTPGVFTRAAADAVEDAVWSAKRDTATGYGIAVFDVDPRHGSDGQPSITVTHYHAVGADPVHPGTGAKGAPTPDYTEFETFTLVRPR
jgi:predicted secreted protein